MTTEHYDPPTADELAAHEECPRRPEMVDKTLEEYAELESLAGKMRQILFSQIRGMRSDLHQAKLMVSHLENEIKGTSKLTGLLGIYLCEDRFETEEEEEE